MRIPIHPSRWTFALFVVGITTCAMPDSPRVGPDAKIGLQTGLGEHHHPITTTSPTTQRYFEQGLILTFGFNHDAAVRSFEEGARIDPNCAMCFWGVGLALGPNINLPMGSDAAAKAFEAVTEAQALAANVTEREQAYIAALAQRYSADPKADRAALDRAYANAMRDVHRRYPDDLDAATLFAEALMDLNPWNHWNGAGEPVAETPEIVATLEYVMGKLPGHPGANHYYIHAVEASPHPEWAESAADRLRNSVPGAGHLVHMPSHIYFRIGRYSDAVEVNELATEADEDFFAWCRRSGIYGALYYPHNVHFVWAAASAEGQSGLALTYARKLVAETSGLPPEDFPFVEDFLPTALFTLARFGKWDAILSEPAPPAAQTYVTGIWHYVRGLALLRTGDSAGSARELAALRELAENPRNAEMHFFGGTAQDNLRIAAAHLEGEQAEAAGNTAKAISALTRAVTLQDALAYTEPPPWYVPQRHALGASLLAAGRGQEAEAVYRKDLEYNPRNGWSLFGLHQALALQGRETEASLVQAGFRNAWQRADVVLSASRF